MGYYENANLSLIVEIKEGLSGNFNVQVYDKDDICIGRYDLDCWAKERMYLDIKRCGKYKIQVTLEDNQGRITPISASRLVRVNDKKCNVQYFIFDKTKPVKVKEHVDIDFKLTDMYYENLPIEKGVLTLWHTKLPLQTVPVVNGYQ